MKFLNKLCCLIAAAIILALFVLVAHAAPWIACKTDGKTWRLIDGRKCWTERHHSKSALYWPKRKIVPRFQGEKSGWSEDRRPEGPIETAPPAIVWPEPPAPASLDEALQAKAEELRAEFRPVRSVLASPLLPVDVIPLPRPRPRLEDQPPERPIFAPHWGLLLALLMLGNAAAGDYD